ncbi:valyl-tRNA synthetase [Bradyrhizobium sp. LM3.6]
MIEKNYQPADIEARMSVVWEDSLAFKAGRPDRRDAVPFTIVIPPPNVTGSLHMGHALNNTLQDILCRFERMRGRDVLWQPGTDHAGIATQMVVERQLMERQQPSRREIGREKFLERVWQWKAESGDTIINQLKRLGASCDWSRERFTMDEGLSKAVVKVFVDLHRDGLIYKDKRLVNWDTKLLTAISDLEVQQTEVKGSLWYLRYIRSRARFSTPRIPRASSSLPPRARRPCWATPAWPCILTTSAIRSSSASTSSCHWSAARCRLSPMTIPIRRRARARSR